MSAAEKADTEKKTEPTSIRFDRPIYRAMSTQRRLLGETVTEFVDASIRLRLAMQAINAPATLAELRMAGVMRTVSIPQCVARYMRRKAARDGNGGG